MDPDIKALQRFVASIGIWRKDFYRSFSIPAAGNIKTARGSLIELDVEIPPRSPPRIGTNTKINLGPPFRSIICPLIKEVDRRRFYTNLYVVRQVSVGSQNLKIEFYPRASFNTRNIRWLWRQLNPPISRRRR